MTVNRYGDIESGLIKTVCVLGNIKRASTIKTFWHRTIMCMNERLSKIINIELSSHKKDISILKQLVKKHLLNKRQKINI